MSKDNLKRGKNHWWRASPTLEKEVGEDARKINPKPNQSQINPKINSKVTPAPEAKSAANAFQRLPD